MPGGKERWLNLTSMLICTAVVLLGTLLYPLVFLFFGAMALIHPLYRRLRPAASASCPEGSREEAGR